MKSSTALFLIYNLVLIAKGYGAIDTTILPEPTVSPVEITKSTSTAVPDETTKLTTTTSSTISSSTTEKPKTTTSPTPTLTPTPTPAPTPTTTPTSSPSTIRTLMPVTLIPVPQAGTWNTSNKDNIIIARMAVQLSITYNVTDTKNKTVLINIPSNNQTNASGIFKKDLQAIKLSWKSTGVDDNSISLVFKNSSSTKTYWLSRMELKIQPEDLPDIDTKKPLTLYHEQGHFNTSIGNSYRCVKLQNFNLVTDNDTQVIGHIQVTDLQFQAFKTGHDTLFGLAEDCAFETPDIVPIAVGCVLAGLVVIILVGYLITRRRQARGYLSM